MPIKNFFANDGKKFCNGCKQFKGVEEFGKQSRRKDGLEHRCKSCFSEYHRKRYKNPEIRKTLLHRSAKWRENNPEKEANKHLVRKFGITIQQYNQMLEDQDGVCAICGKPEKTRRRKKTDDNERLAVDHCHETGKVRGLLCFKCNTAIGSLGDNEDMVRRVVAYLSNSLDKDSFHNKKTN
jgi:hypothetical protein